MRILLAIDDSHSAAAPIREVATRPWPEGTLVRVLTVLESMSVATFVPEGPYVPMVSPEQLRAEEDEANGMVASVARMLKPYGLVAEAAVRRGTAGREIVEDASEWGADLIMMGSHGRTGLRRALMGSVAQWVVARAPCSVEVVRAPAEEHAPQ